MAIRRSTQKAQVIARLAQVAPPGEQFVACVHCETGPSPWWGILLDEIPFVGMVVQLMRRFYFVTLTNTSVVINSANRFTNRPGEIVAAFPRNALPISRLKRAAVWSSLYLQFPGETKPTRLNVDRYWRTELDQFIGGLPAPAVPAQPGAPVMTDQQVPPVR